MVLHRLFIENWMTVIHTSFLFMTLTNAYPTADHPGRRDYRSPSYTYNTQRACSASDTSLSFPLFAVSDDGSSLKDCYPGSLCFYVCSSGYIPSRQSSYGASGFTGVLGGEVSCKPDGTLDLPSEALLCIPSNDNIYIATLLQTSSSLCQKGKFGGFFFFTQNSLNPKVLTRVTLPTTSFSTSLYYVNLPGGDSQYECPAGFSTTNVAIPSPYVLQFVKDSGGDVTIALGWNPFYVSSVLLNRNSLDWGIKILCQGTDCQPCYIDPSKHGLNQCENCEPGNGGSFFCTVKVPKSADAVIFLFSSSSGQNIDTFTGFSSGSSRAPGEAHHTSFHDQSNSRNLADERRKEDRLTEMSGLTQEGELAQKDKEIAEQTQHSQMDSRTFGDQDKESSHKEGLNHEADQGSLSLARGFDHHEGRFKGSLEGGRDQEALDVVFIKISEGDKNLEDFKGFFYGNRASFDRESNKEFTALHKLSDSISKNSDIWKTEECKTLVASITESAQKLCLLLKSDSAAAGSAQKPSGPQLDVVPSNVEPPKQENSAIRILKTKAYLLFVFMGLALFL